MLAITVGLVQPTRFYGIVRLSLGYFALKYDIAQRTDLRRKIGDSRGYFSIGLDY